MRWKRERRRMKEKGSEKIEGKETKEERERSRKY